MPAPPPRGPPSHIPSGTACETCHLPSTPAGLVPANATASVPGSGFASPAPTTAMIHTGVTSGCQNCHENSDLWLDVNQYPISPTVITSGAQYTGFHTGPVSAASTFSVADRANPPNGASPRRPTR